MIEEGVEVLDEQYTNPDYYWNTIKYMIICIRCKHVLPIKFLANTEKRRKLLSNGRILNGNQTLLLRFLLHYSIDDTLP